MTAGGNRLLKYCSRLVPLLTALLFMSACGYHVAGSASSRLVSDQSLWVSFIRNETDSLSAQTVLRRALLEECHALRGLYPASSPAAADLRMSGTLRSYSVGAVSYSGQDLVKQFRLTVEVELELFRKNEATPVWKGTLQAFQEYPANNNDLALQRSSEEAALAAASHILARKFLMAVEQVY